MINDTTPQLGLQLPHPNNDLADDVARLRSALTTLDTSVSARATQADIDAAIAALLDTAPGALDTLNELAAALGDDPNFAATITDQLAGKMPADRKASPTVLGGIKIGDGIVIDSEGVASVPSAAGGVQTFTDTYFTPTAGQTSFSVPGGYVPGQIQVLLNGVEMFADDYTASNGSTVVLAVGASVGDSLLVRKWAQFASADYYTRTQADALLGGKQPVLESGTSIKTLNEVSLLGSGNVSVQQTLESGVNIKTVGGVSLLGSGDVAVSGSLTYEARTGNTILGTADKAKVIRYTTGGFTQTFTAAATLASGWFVYLQNTSTSNVTLDPNASETIDGLTTGVLPPGMALLVVCTGAAFQVVRLDNSPITEVKTSGTSWTCPLGVVRAEVTVVGAGGSPSGSAGGGGGGTAVRNYRTNPGTSYTYAVGGGGPGTGGNSTFTDGINTITGSGGLAATSTTNAGGAATGGDINVPGGTGFYDSPMHVGGASGLGYGRGAVFGTSTGAHASGYGAGGVYGGGGDINSGGLAGVVIIRY